MAGATATIPFDPDSASFPLRKDLPTIEGAPKDAAWIWGPNDFLGRLNLLTPARVKIASAEIKTGEMVPLDLPLNVPEETVLGRKKFEHEIREVFPKICFDDTWALNPQSGTQWDGFRHFAHVKSKLFYNGTKSSDILGPTANLKCSVHHWAKHGMTGRGILLDYYAYAQSQHSPTYDPASHHSISYADLAACGQAQDLDIRPAAAGGDLQVGDIVLIRSGFVAAYRRRTKEENAALARRRSTRGPDNEMVWAGVKQEEAILDWLHDGYFAAVGGDAPSFEAWPPKEKYYLHEYILALWGMPLGEMLDLERLSEMCRARNRWTFFFSGAPSNCPGGVASHVNATAIF